MQQHLRPTEEESRTYQQWIDTPIGMVGVVADDQTLLQVNIIPAPLFLKDPTSKLKDFRLLETIVDQPNYLTQKSILQLGGYFSGQLMAFNLPIPFSESHFCGRACLSLYNYGFGATLSYKDLASRAGNMKASRAAGHAMSSNPIPIVVPCHRVVASNGKLGGFLYGLKMKDWLLKHEAEVLKNIRD